MGLRTYAFHFVFACLLDGDLSEVADDGVNIAPNVTDFSKFSGFDFDKRRIGKLGQTSCDFGFTHAGGANHQNIFGMNFSAQGLGNLLATPAVAQSNSDRAFGAILPDDVFVEFRNNFTGGHG